MYQEVSSWLPDGVRSETETYYAFKFKYVSQEAVWFTYETLIYGDSCNKRYFQCTQWIQNYAAKPNLNLNAFFIRNGQQNQNFAYWLCPLLDGWEQQLFHQRADQTLKHPLTYYSYFAFLPVGYSHSDSNGHFLQVDSPSYSMPDIRLQLKKCSFRKLDVVGE